MIELTVEIFQSSVMYSKCANTAFSSSKNAGIRILIGNGENIYMYIFLFFKDAIIYLRL